VQDLQVYRDKPGRRGRRLTGAGVAGKPGMGPAGDLEPQPVPGREPVSGRAHRHGHRGVRGHRARRAQVPVSIWDVPEYGGRGPRPKHSRAAIAAAAVSLADAEGIDAVTMRRIAADLGMGTMSLYNYVPSKEHLVQLMIDHVSGEYEYADSPSDARAAILDLARQGRDITRRHPWLPRVMQRPPVTGPGALRYVENLLGLLSGSALDTGAKMEILGMVNGLAISYGGVQAALAEERARTGVTEGEQAAAQVSGLVSAAASGRYRNLATALAGPPPPPRDADEVCDRCVLRLIDGALGRQPRG
jgi:AcrR family transcriptional regulator